MMIWIKNLKNGLTIEYFWYKTVAMFLTIRWANKSDDIPNNITVKDLMKWLQ